LLKKNRNLEVDTKIISIIASFFVIIACLIFYICTTKEHFPQTIYPEALFSRPFDLIPLFLLVFAGTVVFPVFYREYASLFSYALIISIIPAIAAQIHIIFGSTILFDNHFNIANFLKFFTYLVIYIGLYLNYIQTYKKEKRHSMLLNAITSSKRIAMFTTDFDGEIITANNAAKLMFEDEEPLNINNLLKNKNKGSIKEYFQHLVNNKIQKHKYNKHSENNEVFGQRKDGSIFPVEIDISEYIIANERILSWIVRDVTKERKAEDMKSEFVSVVSHELRTPLTSIQGSLGLLKGGVGETLPKKASSLVKIAYRNSERLVRLINDILDIEKIESGRISFDIKEHNLVELVGRTIQDSKGYADKYNIQLVFKKPLVEKIVVSVDAGRLAQVINNLIANAIKFSPKNKPVEIRITRFEEQVQVTVTDYGSGIPAEFKEHLFKKFSQADTSDTRKQEGSGLGLSICKTLVEKMNGQISFTTETDEEVTERGTSFYFRLPEIEQIVPEKDRILICEDNDIVSRLLKEIIAGFGHESDIAENAEEAKEMLSKKKYTAMTLDLSLPGQSGLSLLQELRGKPETKELPVVIISATTKDNCNLEGGTLDIFDWLPKPINQKRLEAAIKMTKKASSEKAKILYVEDDLSLTEVVTLLLSDVANVHIAATFEEAKAKLSLISYDLVLLDILLPDGSGINLFPYLQKENKQTPIVIFSSMEDDEKITEEVAAVMIKSKIKEGELLNTIKTILSKKKNESDKDN
ncbi:MAG: response regulator, partial [Alphaproteobacteria bacterium]|nr:response regulator [Alphaproteobacteria bacterium]